MPVAALIIEDDRDVHAQVRAVLEDIPAQVTSTFDRLTGLNAIKGSTFDLIVLNVDLPDTNGLRITEALRRQMGPSVEAVVVGLGGDMTVVQNRRCLNTGMARVINRTAVKPQLLAALRGIGLVLPPARSTTAAATTVFEALANELRIRLITTLARGGPASSSALAKEMAMSRQKVEFHLKALARAKLVESDRQGREILFVARTDGLAAVAEWMIQFAARPAVCPP